MHPILFGPGAFSAMALLRTPPADQCCYVSLHAAGHEQPRERWRGERRAAGVRQPRLTCSQERAAGVQQRRLVCSQGHAAGVRQRRLTCSQGHAAGVKQRRLTCSQEHAAGVKQPRLVCPQGHAAGVKQRRLLSSQEHAAGVRQRCVRVCAAASSFLLPAHHAGCFTSQCCCHLL